MATETITTLKRKSNKGKSDWHEYRIVDNRAGLLGFATALGQPGYISPLVLGQVVEENHEYYVIVKGSLKDANAAIDNYLKNPVDSLPPTAKFAITTMVNTQM